MKVLPSLLLQVSPYLSCFSPGAGELEGHLRRAAGKLDTAWEASGISALRSNPATQKPCQTLCLIIYLEEPVCPMAGSWLLFPPDSGLPGAPLFTQQPCFWAPAGHRVPWQRGTLARAPQGPQLRAARHTAGCMGLHSPWLQWDHFTSIWSPQRKACCCYCLHQWPSKHACAQQCASPLTVCAAHPEIQTWFFDLSQEEISGLTPSLA